MKECFVYGVERNPSEFAGGVIKGAWLAYATEPFILVIQHKLPDQEPGF